MCNSIRLKNGIDIETVEDFEREFKENADDWKYGTYDNVNRTSCLCQLDLDKFMADKKDRFEYDCGDWHEIDEKQNTHSE